MADANQPHRLVLRPALAQATVREQAPLLYRLKQYRYFYLFVACFFVPFAVFWVYPVLHSFYLSLTDWTGFGEPTFIGLRNYEGLVADRNFHQALGNTLVFTGIAVPLQVGFGLILARLLNTAALRLKGVFRALYFTPYLLSPIIVGTLFLFLLDSRFGVVNYGLQLVGLPAVPWLTDPFWMRVSIIMLTVWHWSGWNAVVFLAGMQNLPQEVIESARIDGANELQVFGRIVIPLLRPIIFFAVVIGTISALQMFAEPLALSVNQKGPGNSAYTIVYAIWTNAFTFGRFGKATAMAYVLFALTLIIILIQVRYRRNEDLND